MNRRLALPLALPGMILLLAAPFAQEPTSGGNLLVVLGVVFVLVLINGFFVAAEFAIIGVRPSQVEQLVQKGDRRAVTVHTILESSVLQDRYIATAQLGITIASVGLGMYGEPQIAHFIEPLLEGILGLEPGAVLLHTIGSIVALSLLTYLHIVVGEMVPKSIALATPERAVLSISGPMRISRIVLQWPVRWLNAIGRGLLDLFKIPPAEGHARLHSPEEIELIVSESAEGGLLLETEEEMIRNIFDFGDRQVGQVMTPRTKVQAIDSAMPEDELLQVVTESRHSRFPVYVEDLDHVIGILHLKDLVHQRMRLKGDLDVRLILRPAPMVPEDHSVERLLAAFKRQRIHMAIVIDEFGGLAGIVTLEDLVEEIVGEVRDEFDFETEPLVELAPGSIEVAGAFLVDDLSDLVYLGEEDQLPDVETVGGLVHTWLRRPPQIGDSVKAKENSEVTFTVLDVDGLAVSRVKIEYPVANSKVEETG